MFIGHNIHQKINNEISKKTNLLILKGDLFISLGYYRVSQMGNPSLIRIYSKIAQNFAENIFCLHNFVKSLKGNASSEFQYLNLLVKKYVGLVYYGCSGIREIHQSFLLNNNLDISREFSFKYGLLLFLRTELAFLKEKSLEYYSTLDEFVSFFLLFSESRLYQISEDTPLEIKKQVQSLSKDHVYLQKYKYLAVNLCSDLIGLIETMKKSLENVEKFDSIENMREFLRSICMDVENMTRI